MTSSQGKEGLLLKIANVAAYLLFLGSNIYTTIPPQAIYENIEQTYFTPASWAFFVWPVIHILLFGTVIYQFASTRGKAVVIDGLSWGFPFMAIVNAIFIIVWANHHYTIAFVLSLFLVYIGINIEWTIEKEHPPESVADELFVHLPFYVWNAWTIVICFLTAFEAFGVDATEQDDGIWTKIFVFLALLSLQIISATSAFSSVIGDRAVTFVFSWTLWAIYDHQRSSDFIHGCATAFSILSLIWVFVGMDGIYRKFSGRGTFIADGERAPLLGH